MDANQMAEVLDRRDWEVHFWRWDFHELHSTAQATIKLAIGHLDDEVLDAPLGKMKRSLREHLERGLAEVNRVHSQNEERMHRAAELKLTPVQYRRKFDPLTDSWIYGNPDEEEL
jgi:hypothetical protein